MEFEAAGKLERQVVIVTGAASGIGRSCALSLAETGFAVAGIDIDTKGLDSLDRECAAITGAVPILTEVLNVRDPGDMGRMAEVVLSRFGRIDALIAAAGILRPPGSGPKTVVDMSLEDWDAVLDINLKGVFLSNRAVLPWMIKQHHGQIVNLSSAAGRRGAAFDSAYCASKFGIIGFTESLAEEVRQYGVRVFSVLPAAVDTPLWKQNGPIACPVDALPPSRVAELILYLLRLPEDTVLLNVQISPFRSRRSNVPRKRVTPVAAAQDRG